MRRWLLRTVAVALALAGLLPAAVGASAPAADDARLAAVQAVLDSRLTALRNGEAAAWAATVDPLAPAGFREAQQRQFEGLRSLPLASFSLKARLQDTGDLAAGIPNTYGAPTFLPETRQVHRFSGYDERDAVDTLWLTFVERDGRWYVGGDTDLEGVGLTSARFLWDLGPVATLTTEHFLVVHHPAQADRAATLANIAEEAIAALGRRWDKPWPGRIPMVLPGSVGELETLLQSTIDLDKFVAFVSYGIVRDDDYVVTAPRIYIQDRNLSRYSRQFQVETLLHELVHAAAAPISGPFVPAWVSEGTADWVARDRSSVESKPDGSDDILPRDHEFTTGTQQAIVRSYAESRSATSFLSARRGAGAPTDLLASLGEPKVAPGNVDFQLDAALRRVAGQGFAEFERDWARR